MIRLAYSAEALEPASFERVFRADLASLSRDWRTWALQQFAAVQSPEQQAADYWEHTRIHSFKVCGPDGL